MKDITDGLPPNLIQIFPPTGEEEHSVENCKDHGCPAIVKYDSIFHESEEGIMFDCRNLLVWVSADKLEFCRDDKTFEMCLGEATDRELV